MNEDANFNNYSERNNYKKPESFENDPFVFDGNQNNKNFNETNEDKEYLSNQFDDNLSNNGKYKYLISILFFVN